MADNDKKIIKIIKKNIKNIKFKYMYKNKKIVNQEMGNELIRQFIGQKKPFCVVRYGAVEARCLDKWMRGKKYSEYNKKSIMEAAGFFPNTTTMIDCFCEVYSNAAQDADIVAVWGVQGERKLIDNFGKSAKLIRTLSLEPFFFDEPWSAMLRNRKVLIIHPFVETIKLQLEKREYLFDNPDVLPRFGNVSYVKAVQSNAGEVTEYKTWFEALNFMKLQIRKCDFDIALIGAGAYGLPLASYCKSIGKQAIQMAGATQLLFGIKGKRWEERAEYQKLFNKYWVRPSSNETPSGKNKVEGGSYW